MHTLKDVVAEIQKMVEEMTPILNRVNVTRRLRYSQEWELLDPDEILKAYGWLKTVRKKYWVPCANYYREHSEDAWDLLLKGFGDDMPDVQVFISNLKVLQAAIKTNDRPFFFKIALVNNHIKEIKKCQKD
jgi:hypothetical protein